MNVAVIVVTYNAEGIITECLQSVLEQGLKDVQVLVVDNASHDRTVEVVKNLAEKFHAPSSLRLIANNTNIGFARAVNQGVREVGRDPIDAILLLNPDARLSPTVLSDGMKIFENPGVGACGPIIYYPDGRVWSKGSRVFSNREILLGFHVGVASNIDKGKHVGSLPASFDVEAMTGCCLLIKKSVWEAVGPLDEKFFMYAEDADLSTRIREKGYRIVCYSSSWTVHHTLDRKVSFRSVRKYRLFLVSQLKFLWDRAPLVAIIWLLKLPASLLFEYFRRLNK